MNKQEATNLMYDLITKNPRSKSITDVMIVLHFLGEPISELAKTAKESFEHVAGYSVLVDELRVKADWEQIITRMIHDNQGTSTHSE